MKRTLVITLAAVAAVAAVAAASFAYAAIPSGNGTISACKDSKGALKVIDPEAGQTCNGNQQLLTWNQQGPPGLSNAHYATLPVNAPLLASDDWSTVESLSLPAGDYMVLAVGTVDDASPATDTECLLGGPDSPDAGAVLDYESVIATATDTVERFMLSSPVSWEGSELHLRCRGSGAALWGGNLSAIEVGNLAQQ